jgi:hypothetical protein
LNWIPYVLEAVAETALAAIDWAVSLTNFAIPRTVEVAVDVVGLFRMLDQSSLASISPVVPEYAPELKDA